MDDKKRCMPWQEIEQCVMRGGSVAIIVSLAILALKVPAAERSLARTSLENPAEQFTVPAEPYVVLRRGAIEAVVVDNRAVDDPVLPGHRAGYSGLASLKHARQPRNLFVPSYGGLNFEHIIDGTIQERAVLFEPRNSPMQLRIINPHTVELYQPPTPHYALESCQRFELREDGVIELTIECIPRRKTWQHDYLLLFWASYIDRPESLDIHFRGRTVPDQEIRWIRGITARHGEAATHRAIGDERELAHVQPFPLELPFGFSAHRYAEPWYFGVCRGMAFAQIFRPADQPRLTQSPSGGGTGCPAWDFQSVITNPKVGQRWQFVMQALYSPFAENSGDASARESLRERIKALN